jgi:NhaP-type Na+/H+ and K+/H+ antiporter
MKECKTNDWNVNFRTRKKLRFKNSNDPTEKVNVEVDINEENDENTEADLLALKVKNEEKKEIFDLKLSKKKKVKFKAGADLTDKVNLVDVDWNREETDTEEVSFIGVRIKTTSCIETQIEDKAQ